MQGEATSFVRSAFSPCPAAAESLLLARGSHGEALPPNACPLPAPLEPLPKPNAHAALPRSQPSSNEARYAFVVEWYDPTASLIRQYQLIFYASDNTLEMVRTALTSGPAASEHAPRATNGLAA